MNDDECCKHRFNIQICNGVNFHISITKVWRIPMKDSDPQRAEGAILLPLRPCLTDLHKLSLQTITE
jgi:hypothetical protein